MNLKLSCLIGQSLNKRPRITRVLDPKIIELFKVSPAEVEMVKKSTQSERNAYNYE